MINETLKTIQQRLKATKDLRNNFGGYNYRSCESILEAVKPLLNETNSTLTLNDEIMYIGERYYIKATATLRVGEETISVSAFAREEETKKGMDGSQITGSSSSYARKYALNGLFAIDDNKDSDATNTYGKEEPTKQEASFKPITAQQLEEYSKYGYGVDLLIKKFNKPTNKISYEELESVLETLRSK